MSPDYMYKPACVKIRFESYRASVTALLDALGADKIIARQRRILIKPNLVNDSPPPVTTPVECCEAIAEYISRRSNARIFIGDGCGAAGYDTGRVFDKLGYTGLADRMKITLIDLNHAPLIELERGDCRLFPSMKLPRIAFESFILSVPVLKAHSLAGITGTLKNMMGFAPPACYQEGGHWKKSSFHGRMHESIIELNRYVTPALTVMDCRKGLAEHHLGGAECDPPPGVLLGGYDAAGIDREAAKILGLDWRVIGHLRGEQHPD